MADSANFPSHLKKFSLNSPNKTCNLAKADFLLKQTCIQGRFLRTANVTKLTYLKNLFQYIKNTKNMHTWLTILRGCTRDKLLSYNKASGWSSLTYDKILADNNRSLEQQTLEITMEEEIDWFKHLDEEVQAELFIGLCRLGGAGLINWMANYMRIEYRNELKDTNIFNTAKLSLLGLDKGKLISSKEDFDVRSPLQKEWNETITKYRKEVLYKLEREINVRPFSKEKVNRTGKGSLLKKEEHVIDYIQLMPIAITKRIFMFLDKKVLKKIKEVNIYWAFAVESLEGDYRARRNLDRSIQKIEESLVVPLKPISLADIKIRPPEEAIEKLLRAGTCNVKIRKMLTLKDPYCQTCVLSAAINQVPHEYLNSGYIKPFPRKSPDPNELYKIYRDSPCYKFGSKEFKKKALEELKEAGDIKVYEKIEIIEPRNSLENLSELGEGVEPYTPFSNIFVPLCEPEIHQHIEEQPSRKFIKANIVENNLLQNVLEDLVAKTYNRNNLSPNFTRSIKSVHSQADALRLVNLSKKKLVVTKFKKEKS